MADLLALTYLHELNLTTDPDPGIRADAAYRMTASDFLPNLSDDDQRLVGDALVRALLTDSSGQVRAAVAQSMTAPSFLDDPTKLDLVTKMVLALRQVLASEGDSTAAASEKRSIQVIQAVFSAPPGGSPAEASSTADDDGTFPWSWLFLLGGLTVMATGGVLLYRDFRKKPAHVVG